MAGPAVKRHALGRGRIEDARRVASASPFETVGRRVRRNSAVAAAAMTGCLAITHMLIVTVGRRTTGAGAHPERRSTS
jgi:hypothetical protein